MTEMQQLESKFANKSTKQKRIKKEDAKLRRCVHLMAIRTARPLRKVFVDTNVVKENESDANETMVICILKWKVYRTCPTWSVTLDAYFGSVHWYNEMLSA